MRMDAETAGEKFFAELNVPVNTPEGDRLFEQFCEDFDAAMEDAYNEVVGDMRSDYWERVKALAPKQEENPSA